MAAIPTILKGDDSGAITFTMATGHTYTGATLVLAYQGVTRNFTDLSAGQTVTFSFTHDETAGMEVKTAPILMRLVGSTGAEETVENAEARIKVTDCLADVNAGGSFVVRPGGSSTDPTKVPITELGDVSTRYTLADLQSKVNQIVRVLAQRSMFAIALACASAALPTFAAIEIQTARIDALYNDSLVVTNVTGASGGGLTTNDVSSIVSNTVTKAYVESLGISGGGIDTNAVNAIIASSNLVTKAVTNALSSRVSSLATSLVSATNGVMDHLLYDYPDLVFGRKIKTTFDVIADGTVAGCYIEGRNGWSSFINNNNQELPAYLAWGEWNTASDPFAKVSQIPADQSATVSALVTTTATHTATIAGWENYWSGGNVRLSVTNYYGNTSGELPRLRIEEFDHSTTTTVDNVQIVSNYYKTVWDEEARHTNYQAQVDRQIAQIGTNVLDQAWQQTYLQLAGKAPKNWGDVTSNGTKAPENTVWHTAPNTVFAGGTEYAHVSVGEGTICVLTDAGAPVYTEGEEGKFRFKDDSGQYYFGFDVRESYTIGCRTDGISVNPTTHLVTLTYDLTSSSNPEIYHCTNLLTGTWNEIEVEWETNPPVAGTKVCYINCGTNPQGFYKAAMAYAGGAKFVTNMQVDLLDGIAASNEVANVFQSIYPTITSTGIVWRVRQ